MTAARVYNERGRQLRRPHFKHLWLHGYVAGPATEVETIRGIHDLEAIWEEPDDWRVVIVLREAGLASLAAGRAPQVFVPLVSHGRESLLIEMQQGLLRAQVIDEFRERFNYPRVQEPRSQVHEMCDLRVDLGALITHGVIRLKEAVN
jgi:hypothetical protein